MKALRGISQGAQRKKNNINNKFDSFIKRKIKKVNIKYNKSNTKPKDERLFYFIKKLGLSKYYSNFVQKNINFEEFLVLSNEDLSKMNIPKNIQKTVQKYIMDYFYFANYYTLEELKLFFHRKIPKNFSDRYFSHSLNIFNIDNNLVQNNNNIRNYSRLKNKTFDIKYMNQNFYTEEKSNIKKIKSNEKNYFRQRNKVNEINNIRNNTNPIIHPFNYNMDVFDFNNDINMSDFQEEIKINNYINIPKNKNHIYKTNNQENEFNIINLKQTYKTFYEKKFEENRYKSDSRNKKPNNINQRTFLSEGNIYNKNDDYLNKYMNRENNNFNKKNNKIYSNGVGNNNQKMNNKTWFDYNKKSDIKQINLFRKKEAKNINYNNYIIKENKNNQNLNNNNIRSRNINNNNQLYHNMNYTDNNGIINFNPHMNNLYINYIKEKKIRQNNKNQLPIKTMSNMNNINFANSKPNKSKLELLKMEINKLYEKMQRNGMLNSNK